MKNYTDKIYGIHWAVAFGAPALALACIIAACLLLTGCVSLDVGLKRRDVPLTRFYTYLPYVELDIGAVDD